MEVKFALPAITCAALMLVCGCRQERPAGQQASAIDSMPLRQRINQYATVRLTTDLSQLTRGERRMLPLLIDAAREMDTIYWQEAYGSPDTLFHLIGNDSAMLRYAEINYGPWDRLASDSPFVPGVGPKPPGANLYPADMTREQFQAALDASPAHADSLKSLYTLVRRNPAGGLEAVPYHVAFAAPTERAASRLEQAAKLADDPGLRHYLSLRAQALRSDRYRASDIAWLDMKNNGLDIVIGPIETYEDQLFGYKAAHEAYVLVKDKAWSRRLARYAALLPGLQRALPVEARYKQEKPGTDSDLNAYDAVFYAGQANAGAKTIAINLPNDERVQLEKGTRRLQLKNAMRAKFDSILVPIADRLIAPDQRSLISFDAFFENTMFHEVAHGLGIKNTVNGRGTVREALKEQAGALEEGKADVLGLWMVTRLNQTGELPDEDIRKNYVTFLASIFRSIRFGAADAHGRANLVRFNFFRGMGAFSRDSATGTYRVNFDRMQAAVDSLSQRILEFQGNGDYEGVKRFVERYGTMEADLQHDLQRLTTAGIPVDVVFEQGMTELENP